MDMSRYIEKAIPPQAKLIALGMGSLMGCSGPTSGEEEDEAPSRGADTSRYDPEVDPQNKSFKTGQSVCFVNGSDESWATIDEDLPAGHLAVRVVLPNGKKKMINTDSILPNDECVK